MNNKNDRKKLEELFNIILPDSYDCLIPEKEIYENKKNIFSSNINPDGSFFVEKILETKDIIKLDKIHKFSKIKFFPIIKCNDFKYDFKFAFISLRKESFGEIFTNNCYVDKNYKIENEDEDDFSLSAKNIEEIKNGLKEEEIFPFQYFCENYEFDKALELLKNGLDVNSMNFENEKLILIATNQYKQDLNLIKFLIDNGANINEIGEISGVTPLTLSVGLSKNPEVVKFLIDNGADIYYEYDEQNAFEQAKERLEKNPKSIEAKEIYNILYEKYYTK